MSNELYHYGVKGMKWGVRRYQNKDGTLTEAGKRRQQQYDTAQTVVNESKKAVNNVNKVKTTYDKLPIAKEASVMSDEELRQRVNRLSLEKQYTDLSSQQVSRGSAYASMVLDSAGTVLAVGASALSIMLAIDKLRH